MYYYLNGYAQGYYYYPEANATVAMDGMVLPQSSAMHADSEFAGRCAPGDSNITLWQFLLELLRDGGYPHLIQWTNREGEFKLLNAEGVAQLWGKRKGKEHMNYDKLSRALRYYYDKNIIKKVIGQKFVYRFVGNYGEGPANETWNTVPKQEQLSYLQQYARATVTTGMKNMMNPNGQMQQVIPKREDLMMPFVPTSTSSLSSPQQQQMQTSDLASLNLSGVSTSSHDTPSPTDSSCSPNSICSSSGVSSAVPTAATTPPTCNSRPGSAHSDDYAASNASGFQPLPRKRKASPPPPIKVEKDSHHRRCRPENLNLASTQYLNATLPMAISPMNVISQMSPFLLNQQMQLYALASASFGPNSPLFSGNLGLSPLSTPKMPSVFQFPPVSASVSVASTLANLMSPAMMSAGLTGGAGSIFKFPGNDILKTPTMPSLSKTVPVANSDS